MRRFVLIALMMVACVLFSQGSIKQVDEVLATLENKSNETLATDVEFLVSTDSVEDIVLGFLQSVGDLNTVQFTSISMHGKCAYINANEIANIIRWYKYNKRYFTDEMYETYCRTLKEYPMYSSDDRHSIYVYERTNSKNYRKNIDMLRNLRREFMRAKYPNIDLYYE